MSNIVIDIAAQFTGKKAFKQAETSAEKLTKSVKKLAGAFGIAFGTTQIIAFGKASVKAALEAQAQQERLTNLLKVTVGATESEIDALNKQAEALQRIGVVNKENITQTQSQLATFNLQISTIERLTPAILDYVTAEKGAAASADEFKSMTNGLAQALNGNFASLTKTGFVLDEVTKKTIKEGTETERAAALVKVLDSTYKDFNKNLAKTPSGQMVNLANAANDAQQIIGEGLIAAFMILGENTTAEDLADDFQRGATNAAAMLVTLSKIIKTINTPIDVAAGGLAWFIEKTDPFVDLIVEGDPSAILGLKKPALSKNPIQSGTYLATQKKITKLVQQESLAQTKILKDKKLQLAIDKANLALGKGEGIFDIDKIQIAAALTNQAQLLGKATESSQILQIANDTARLNVKRSMLALEEAIASKDEAAIVAATAKLNEDLKILGALTNQKTQMVAIESILKGLIPKDLINQNNLDEALRKIREMMLLLSGMGKGTTIGSAGASAGATIGGAGAGAGTGLIAGVDYNPSQSLDRNRDLLDQIAAASAAAAIPIFAAITGSGRGAGAGEGQIPRGVDITINTGIGDPEAIARALEDYIRSANQRGTTSFSLL